ncbi:MAG: hypothetical protein JF591_08955 [Lysobacter sp.]|nr:hypothetical protein [Lysobacter sp.]
MHDQAGMPGPDVVGNRRLQHRRDDQLRPFARDRGAHGVRIGRDLHRDLVAQLAQLGPGALRQSVVGGAQEQDTQRHRTLLVTRVVTAKGSNVCQGVFINLSGDHKFLLHRSGIAFFRRLSPFRQRSRFRPDFGGR